MQNDLTPFEKNLLKVVNLNTGKKYTHKNLMEWSTDEKTVQDNLQEGEIILKAMGCYVAIKEEA